MSDRASQILSRLKESRSVALTPDEVTALEAESAGSVTARQLLSVHYFNEGDYDRSAEHARAVFAEKPSQEAAENLASVLIRAGAFVEARDLLERSRDHVDEIVAAERLCQIHMNLGDRDATIAHARAALTLKDEAAARIDRPTPVTRAFDASKPERNVISFSLFGDNPRYLNGARNNAIVCRYLYPGWTARFYVDDSVPESFVHTLLGEGAQIRKAPKLPAATYGLFWRFLVEDDPNVDFYLIRDADSVVNIRERAAVEDWLKSGRPYHVMRDYPSHCELILAGMWGAHRGNLEPMGKRILSFVKANADRLNDRTNDQKFLREVVWPLIRRDAFIQDEWIGYGGAEKFRSEFRLPWPMHIGQNDFVRFKKKKPGG